MSGAAFPSPAAEMAEINRLQYEMEYTEGISQRMRVPEKLKVAPPNADLEKDVPEGFPNASVTMQVPERIVVAGNSEDIPLSRPPDLDLLQSTPFKPLALKTPPRVISLSDRPLDFLDLEKPPQQTPQNEEVRSVGRLKRERSMSENATRQNGQLARNDSLNQLLVQFLFRVLLAESISFVLIVLAVQCCIIKTSLTCKFMSCPGSLFLQ
uniref:Mitochondrial fission factor n=1 Tax=Anas platyrhynchos platyrhynchos TaxID=8840 RepID=U3I779_ANAPP